MGIRIDALAAGLADRAHVVPAMKDGETVKLAISALLGLIDRTDLPPNVESALALAESALQSVPDNAVTTAKIATSSVTNTKLANMAQATVKGRASGDGAGVPTDLVASDLFTILGGLVPAKPQTASGVGQFVLIDTSGDVGNGYSLPLGGTWAYFALRVGNTGSVPGGNVAGGVAAGGTTILAALANHFIYGFAWRIA